MKGNLPYIVSMSYVALQNLSEEVFQHADRLQESELHGVAFLLDCVANELERALKAAEVME